MGGRFAIVPKIRRSLRESIGDIYNTAVECVINLANVIKESTVRRVGGMPRLIMGKYSFDS